MIFRPLDGGPWGVQTIRPLSSIAVCLLFAVLAACDPAPDPADQAERAGALTGLTTPAELRPAEALFDAHCADCHGQRALGSPSGPPLVHPVYEPAHHSDFAFFLAVERGVRAHHWGYGDMPPIPGLNRDQIAEIVAYIRWLQRAAGIH